MRKRDLVRRLKGVLEKRRRSLRQTLHRDIDEIRSGTGIESGDVAEIALDDTFELVSSQLAESESRELAQVEGALERIRRGTYGQCRGCGHDIPVARLEALPYAARCVKCEREAEKNRETSSSGGRYSSLGDAGDESEDNPFLDHVADIF